MDGRHCVGARLPGTQQSTFRAGTSLPAAVSALLAIMACGNQASSNGAEGDLPVRSARKGDSTLASLTRSPVPQAEMRAAPPPTVSADAMQGRVYLTGASPNQVVSLQRDNDRSVRLAGELEAELGRLSGAMVRVHGAEEGQGAMSSLNVLTYEVLEIDGAQPLVGVLQEDGGRLRIATDPPLILRDAPEGLAAKVGAKIWIVGQVEAATVHVRSFGIIRDP